VQILRLRRKLETDPSTPSMIRTERGIGYVFAVPVEQL
jgi:DNA-binding response OmpR family regulator